MSSIPYAHHFVFHSSFWFKLIILVLTYHYAWSIFTSEVPKVGLWIGAKVKVRLSWHRFRRESRSIVVFFDKSTRFNFERNGPSKSSSNHPPPPASGTASTAGKICYYSYIRTAVEGRGVNEASLPDTRLRPCAFEVEKTKNNEIPPKHTTKTQRHGDRG